MRYFLSLTSCLSLALLAPSAVWAGDAEVISNNPQGVQYIADIEHNGLVAQIVAETPLDGEGVLFAININGNKSLDSANYIYHIHELPIPTNGNCTAAKAHLDPYARGETPPCDDSNPASCQVGDLSGKHGSIPHLPGFSANYTDKYISLVPNTPAYMGNRSFVLHFANKTRITCANFIKVEKMIPYSNSSSSAGTSTATSSVMGGGGFSTPTGNTPTGPTKSSTALAPSSAGAAAGAQKTHHAASIYGPLIFGVAAAVW